MKLYEILCETKIDYLANSAVGNKLLDTALRDNSFPKNRGDITPKTVVQALTIADPTPQQKALVYIVNLYARGLIKFEDMDRTRDEIVEFFKSLPKLKAAGKSIDISSYTNRNDFLDAIESVADTPTEVSNKQIAKQTKLEGAVKVAEGDGITIIKLLTHKAACFYGKGTKWCTAGRDSSLYDNYNKQGPIYVIIAGNRKFQLHVESDQFKDERDNDVNSHDIELLSANPTYTTFLNNLIRQHYGV